MRGFDSVPEPMTPLKLTMQGIDALNDNTVNIRFAVDSEQPFVVIAGQFLRLHFTQNDGFETFRSYSVATIFPEEKATLDEIEIAVSWVPGGLATEKLSAMQAGDQLDATGPYGRFCLLPDRHDRYFLIATGTGVTPYRAMLNEIELRLQSGSEFYVVMGAQDESGLLYEADFRAMEARHDNFHYIPCLSRKQRPEPQLNDQTGYVQHYLAGHDFDPENDITYLCGNPNMVDECYQLLKNKGLPVPLIKREKYVSPPVRKK
jgi:ferredoxin-NADP reductase